MLLSLKKHSKGFTKVMSDFNPNKEKSRKAFILAKSVALETFVQCFQLKPLNDILFFNSRFRRNRKDSK